ncbi:MAG: peptide chain release factor N(5)-glutamine methyltransferase [Flavobacteriales bacterium]|nr:peptide chain release factor N(5)-glutamine methyltransferase [Flavobacteriales bacterium]
MSEWPNSNGWRDVIAWVSDSLESLYDERESRSIAQILVEFQAEKNKIQLISSDHHFSEMELVQIKKNVSRLLQHEPLQHLIGEVPFLDLRLAVSSEVLIPRPETEEWLSHVLNNFELSGEILDVGTGSGAIGLGVAQALPGSKVTCLDVSKGALNVAKSNAQNNALKNVTFIEQDFRNFTSDQPWDFIFSNPPYIPEEEKKSMAQNVLDFEPHIALFVPNNNPLLFYSLLRDFAETNLKINGRIFLEIHEDFSKEVMALFESDKWTQIDLFHDLQNKPRMVSAQFLG